MDKDLANGNIGTVGKYDLAFEGGKVNIKASVQLPEATLELTVSVSPKQILDAIAQKVGGPIPAEVAAFLDTALGLQ